MIHDLKIYPEHFELMIRGIKTFEIRKDDRNFQIGDFLYLREWDYVTKEYTGRDSTRLVLYTLRGGQFGIEPGYVVMSLGSNAYPKFIPY